MTSLSVRRSQEKARGTPTWLPSSYPLPLGGPTAGPGAPPWISETKNSAPKPAKTQILVAVRPTLQATKCPPGPGTGLYPFRRARAPRVVKGRAEKVRGPIRSVD